MIDDGHQRTDLALIRVELDATAERATTAMPCTWRVSSWSTPRWRRCRNTNASSASASTANNRQSEARTVMKRPDIL